MNRLPNDQLAQYFIIMKALLNVMESSNPSPNDINTLMVLTRDLIRQIPEGSIQLPFNFGSNDIGNVDLPETGDIIVNIREVPHIVTQMGKSCSEYTGVPKVVQVLPKVVRAVLTQGSAHATLLSTRMTLGAPHFI